MIYAESFSACVYARLLSVFMEYIVSRNGHFNVVKYLVDEVHCDPHVVNEYGWTPLRYACK